MRVEREHNSPTLVVFRLVPLFWCSSVLFSLFLFVSLSLNSQQPTQPRESYAWTELARSPVAVGRFRF